MAGIGETLQKKVGPAPVWVWLVGGGAAVFLIGPRLGGLFSGITGQGQSQQQGPGTANQGIPPGYVPVSEVGIPQQTLAPPNIPVSQTVAWSFGPQSGSYVWRPTAQGISYAQAKWGVQVENQVQPGPISQDTLGLTGPFGTEGAPVPSGNDPSGNLWTAQSYAAALNAAGAGGGSGVGGPARVYGSRSMGSRNADITAAHHPSIKDPIRYAHYVGGPAAKIGKRSGVHGLAKKAGVNPMRLAAINGLRNMNETTVRIS